MPYTPVEIKAVAWARVYKEILKRGKQGIPIYDLEDLFKVERNSPELRKSIEQLIHNGRIRVSIGQNSLGMICLVAQPIVPIKRSKRYDE